MTAGRQQQIEQLLMNLLPADGSTVGNAKLFEQVNAAANAASVRCGEQDFAVAREAPVGTNPPRGAPASGEPQVLSYRQLDKRKNSPEAGLVSEASRHAQWRDELSNTGTRRRVGQMLKFADIDAFKGITAPYLDTACGELASGGKAKIAMWSPDTDYDGRSAFPHQVFFP